MLPQIDPITAAVLSLADRLQPVGHEERSIEGVAGRVLAQTVTADRDNPPLNVSAMDGYAVRLAEITRLKRLPVAGVIAAGHPALPLPVESAVQIFTGAPVPLEADCVLPREQTIESPGQMQLNIDAGQLKLRMNIRYQGENAAIGSEVLPGGTELTSAAMAGLASVAGPRVSVHRPVRVAIFNTGDELIPAGQPVQPWQIRDSNGPTLSAALERLPWIEVISRQRVEDSLDSLIKALNECATADAILFTGGVSMGDTDHVPAAIKAIGGDIVFHRLPIRPGKPVLGAVHGRRCIIGLPGNPVSVAVTFQLVAVPLLRRLAGLRTVVPPRPLALVAAPDDKQLNLHWYRLIELNDDGTVSYIDNRGSGDLVALSRSAGFIEQPAGAFGAGPWRLTLW